MKIILYTISMLFLFYSCNTVQENKNLENEEYNQLLELEKEIFEILEGEKKQKKIILSKKGRTLHGLASTYIEDHQEDILLERAYELAALGAEIEGKYNDAINYLYQAQQNFPNSKNAPVYLFNRARILEDKLKKKKGSRLAYEELIKLYPNDPLAIEMKSYLESPLWGKSEEEVLNFLKSN